MHARIRGLGQWFPEKIRKNSDWPPAFSEASRLGHGDRRLWPAGGFGVVRFRNVLKDTRDTIFILWAIMEGVAIGTTR